MMKVPYYKRSEMYGYVLVDDDDFKSLGLDVIKVARGRQNYPVVKNAHLHVWIMYDDVVEYLRKNPHLTQKDVHIDHINNDRTDNRRCNLQILTVSEHTKKGWNHRSREVSEETKRKRKETRKRNKEKKENEELKKKENEEL